MPGQAAGDSPGFVAPMLATGVAELPPDAAEFVAEVKWDGLRACTAVARGEVRAWSRNGRDITAAYPELGMLTAAAGFAHHAIEPGGNHELDRFGAGRRAGRVPGGGAVVPGEI